MFVARHIAVVIGLIAAVTEPVAGFHFQSLPARAPGTPLLVQSEQSMWRCNQYWMTISICGKIYWTYTHVFCPTCTHAHTQTCSPSSSRIMPHHTRFSRGIHTQPCYQLHRSISTCPLCTYYVLTFDHLSQPSDDAPQVLPLLPFQFFLMLLL